MQYINKYATEDKLREKTKCTQIRSDPYFDQHGVLKPGYTTQFEIDHIALLALMQWGQENAYVKKELYKKHKLRFVTNNTVFGYEMKTLVSMMHWDTFNKSFKFGCIIGHLKKKNTSFKELHEKTELMLKERDRLFNIGEVKVRLRKTRGRWCWNYLAATHIQRWWLRNHRKYRIYKNIYQLMDEYSVEGGFTGQDSAKYLGIGNGKNLLKIQEDIMKKVEMRRIKCVEVSKSFVNTLLQKGTIRRIKYGEVSKSFVDTLLQKVININIYGARQEKARRDFFHERELFNISHGLAPTIYGFGPSTRWDDHDEPYYCEPCATRDLSYPGGGRASGSLDNPRWAAQCNGCGKKNPYYHENAPSNLKEDNATFTSEDCHETTPSPETFFSKWARRLGLTR